MAVFVERRLKKVSRRLIALRHDLSVVDEQLAHFAEITDDTRLRALVSETPLADEEHRDAERSSTAMARSRASLVESIARLEAEQDELLDQLTDRRKR